MQIVPSATRNTPKQSVKRISGASVLTSAKCAALLQEQEEKNKKEEEEKESRAEKERESSSQKEGQGKEN